MKFYLPIAFVLFLGLTANAEDKKTKTRKPANSAWLYCTAYSLDGWMARVEFGEDSRASLDPFVKVNGENAESVQIKRNMVMFKYDSQSVIIKLVRGKPKLTQSWHRGDTEIYDFTGEANDKNQFLGVCSSYNYP